MKPRRVTWNLEIETDVPLKELRNAKKMEEVVGALIAQGGIKILQAQANVIRKGK